MLHINPLLQSLIEAVDPKKDKSKDGKKVDDKPTKPDDVVSPDTEDTSDSQEETKSEKTSEEPEAKDEGTEDPNENDGGEENEEEGSEESDEGGDEGNETEPGEEGSEGGDDFSMDDDSSGQESEDTPDGLTDPDDDGSSDNNEDADGETNLHINILNISNVERALAKKRCLQDLMDLRSTIDSLSNIVIANESVLDPDVRKEILSELNSAYSNVTEYLRYKFSYTNYEENLQNYLLFVHTVNRIVVKLHEKGISGK